MDENVRKAMTFESPDVIPVNVSILPATWMKYREELEDILIRHPAIFGNYVKGSHDINKKPETYREGEHVDPWGCVWSNIHEGCEAIVTHHPVPTREAVRSLKAPEVDGGIPHGFMYLRLADLRGFEELMLDFAEEPPELQMLIDIVLDYNMDQLEKLLKSNSSELLYFGDDLGMQHSLPISPEKWRKYLKPCYARIYGRCHEDNRWVYMHSDGQIYPIIQDLIECGVNIINPQVRANGLDNLVKVCKGKVCVDLDLDRQMFPFCTPKDIEEHVEEAVRKLGSPQGGLMLTAECGPDVPLENIEAICCALERYQHIIHERGISNMKREG
ncbi:MAG: uroporphyrinogen decarboxylase family protein [Clostridia bacterium]